MYHREFDVSTYKESYSMKCEYQYLALILKLHATLREKNVEIDRVSDRV